MIKIFRRSQIALMAASVTAGLFIAAPAFAINDDGRGSTIESLLDMVGMGDAKESDSIQYRERSPLVVPPKMDMPTPQPRPSQKAEAWPQDQEIARARKKQVESNARVMGKYAETNGGEKLSPEEMRAMRTPGAAGSATNRQDEGCRIDKLDRENCSPAEYWGALSAKTEKKDELTLQAGVEPPREYLTQPPKGYLKATQNVKATFEPNRKEEEDPRSFFRDQRQKKDE
jgi:hypothetical protein